MNPVKLQFGLGVFVLKKEQEDTLVLVRNKSNGKIFLQQKPTFNIRAKQLTPGEITPEEAKKLAEMEKTLLSSPEEDARGICAFNTSNGHFKSAFDDSIQHLRHNQPSLSYQGAEEEVIRLIKIVPDEFTKEAKRLLNGGDRWTPPKN